MGESGKFTLSIAISTLPFVESCVCFAQVWLASAMGLKLLSETQRLPLLGNDVAFPDLVLSFPALGSQLLLELQCVSEVGAPSTKSCERTLGRLGIPLEELLARGEHAAMLRDSSELDPPRALLRLAPHTSREDQGRVLHQGWLWKADSTGSAWKRRFCVLLPRALLRTSLSLVCQGTFSSGCNLGDGAGL